MQYVNCRVYLGGDRNNAKDLVDKSVAEVRLLQEIHGVDSIDMVEIVREDDDGLDPRAEKERLMDAYPRRTADVEMLYPGGSPRLPTTLRAVGMENVVVVDNRARGIQSAAKPAPKASTAAKAPPKAPAKKAGTAKQAPPAAATPPPAGAGAGDGAEFLEG